MSYTSKIERAQTVAAAGALTEALDTRQFSPKSTSTEAQRLRVLEALRTGPKTSHDLRCLGIYQAPARVKELRDRFGCHIETQRVTLIDRDGYLHPRAARYALISEPARGDGQWSQ